MAKSLEETEKLKSVEFDEYEYLEKTVEVEENRNYSSRKSKKTRDGADKSERSYRKREGDDDEDVDDGDDEERKSKKSRGDDELNGEKRERGDRERSSRDKDRHRSGREEERDRKDGRRERDGEREVEKERDRDRDRERGGREKDREKERGKEREKDKERDKEKERGREREREREKRERDKEKERERERKEREKEKEKEKEKEERSRRSRSISKSRKQESERDRERDVIRDREREFEPREGRRLKEKKEAVEPEVDPERDQRTVFAYQMPLKANERDVYEFFSKAGKVRDVRLIMDRNSRRSKGVGYIEFYDAMSVPMAIALSGQLLLNQPVMVKPSEAEKNLVQSTASGGGSGGLVGPYGPVDRKLYVGNLHFNMTELQLRQIFEPFGTVELVQLPLDLETGHCKGFGFVQFAQVEHAKAAQSLNGKLEIAGRVIKVSSVTDHVGSQDTGAKSADFDDDDGGGLALNAHSRALLMQKLDRSGVASSIAGSLGVPVVNGSVPNQALNLPINGQVAVPGAVLPTQVVPPLVSEPVGNPSECLLLKNMFDPATEMEPDFDLDIKEEVEEECSNFGRVRHIYVDKNSTGFVYLRFETVEAAMKAQRAMHMRWYARRLISAIYMLPHEYEAKFKGES